MKICNFIKPELDNFRANCNFTDEELQFFEYRAKDMPISVISSYMNISESKANRLSKQIKKKIMRII